MRIINNNTKNIKLYYTVDGVECYLQLRPDHSSVTLSTGEVLTLVSKPLLNGLPTKVDSKQKEMAFKILSLHRENNGLPVSMISELLKPSKKSKKIDRS